MPQLVEHGLANLFDHLRMRGADAFMGALEDRDAVRQHAGVSGGTLGDRRALVEAEQLPVSVGHADVFFVRRLVGHGDCNVGKRFFKPFWNGADRLGDGPLEFRFAHMHVDAFSISHGRAD